MLAARRRHKTPPFSPLFPNLLSRWYLVGGLSCPATDVPCSAVDSESAAVSTLDNKR